MSHSPTNPLSDDVITGMLNQHEKNSADSTASEKLYPRKCEECGKGMDEGYRFGDTVFCSDHCAFDETYTKEMYEAEWEHINKEWDKGNERPADKMECYWTNWDELDSECNYNAKGEEVER